MNDDLISRQAATQTALEFIVEYLGGAFYEHFQKKMIERMYALPSAQRWIPVTERLPEDKQPVIFSTKTGRVHQGKYYKDGSVNQWYSALDKMRAFNNVVNAWMPLPEPYEERRQK